MPTATERLIDNELTFTSSDREKLLPALRLIFGYPAATLWVKQRIDGGGYHLISPGSHHGFISEHGWVQLDFPSKVDDLPMIDSAIREWLDNLTYEEALRMCPSRPTEGAYTADPAIALSGFRVVLTRTRDRNGQHNIVTVTPAWV